MAAGGYPHAEAARGRIEAPCRRLVPKRLGKPRDIVSPGVIEVVIQEDRWKQAKFEGRARSEPLDDLPGAEIVFVRVGAHEVEVELVGVRFGEEVAPAGERFQVKELIFFEAMYGFDIALVSMRSRWDAHVLAVEQRRGEVAFELPAVVGLPNQIAQRDAIASQVLLDARSEHGADSGTALLGEGPEEQPAANFAGGVLDQG